MSGNNDEIDFLLSDVNDGNQKKPKPKKPVKSSSTSNLEDSSTTRTQPTISSPLSSTQSPVTQGSEDGEFSHYTPLTTLDKRQMLYYFLAGFGSLLLTMFAILSIGLLISETGALISWVFLWLVVCGGGIFCMIKKPLALNICNGVAVAMIFGMLSLTAFTIYADIDGREIYHNVNVTTRAIEPVDGSIVFFNNGVIDTTKIGQSYSQDGGCSPEDDCAKAFFCVAPIVPSLTYNASTIQIFFWAACQVDKLDQDCRSSRFNSSECFENWKASYRSGFVDVMDNLNDHFTKAIADAISDYQFTSSRANNSIVVFWVPNPLEEAATFWVMGVLTLCGAPLVYAIYSVVYMCMCNDRIRRKHYEPIPEEK